MPQVYMCNNFMNIILFGLYVFYEFVKFYNDTILSI